MNQVPQFRQCRLNKQTKIWLINMLTQIKIICGLSIWLKIIIVIILSLCVHTGMGHTSPRMSLLHTHLSCASSLSVPDTSYRPPYTLSKFYCPTTPLAPSNFKFLHADTQSLGGLSSTCPNYLNLLCLTTSPASTIPKKYSLKTSFN